MWAGSCHWSGVRPLYVMHSGALELMPGVSGVLPLAMVEASGQMGASGGGVHLCISGDGVLVLVCLCCLLGTGVS